MLVVIFNHIFINAMGSVVKKRAEKNFFEG